MTEPAPKIVELKGRASGSKEIDLRQDNRINSLLDEYEDAVVVYLEAKRVRDELHTEIVDKMSGAERGLVNGWRLTMPWIFRRAYTVKETNYQKLILKRTKPKVLDK